MAVKKKVVKKAAKKTKKMKVSSIRVYYLDHDRRIEEKDVFVYGIEQQNLQNVNFSSGKQLKTWAMKKMKVQKTRNFKLEVRSTKGRFLFDK